MLVRLVPKEQFQTLHLRLSAYLTASTIWCSSDFPCSIDGVLLRSSKPVTRAPETLQFLQTQRIPFILLTNGGGTHETARVAELMDVLGVSLDTTMFVQSHTPFADLVHGNGQSPALKDRCILVTGGNQDNCRKVAEE